MGKIFLLTQWGRCKDRPFFCWELEPLVGKSENDDDADDGDADNDLMTKIFFLTQADPSGLLSNTINSPLPGLTLNWG